MSEEYSSGCLIDPAVRDASVIELMTDGRQPICGDNPGIKGAWERLKNRGVRVVFMAPLMSKYFPTRRNDLQNGNRSAKPIPVVSHIQQRAALLAKIQHLARGIGRPAIGMDALQISCLTAHEILTFYHWEAIRSWDITSIFSARNALTVIFETGTRSFEAGISHLSPKLVKTLNPRMHGNDEFRV